MLPAPALPNWLAQMVPFRRSVYEVDGLHLHVMEDGDPKGRPVLLLHGNPTWGFLYRKVAFALRDSGLRLIMPDLVGLGFSDKPRDLAFHTLDRHGAIIAGLIDHLGLDDLVFVGQDWGGPIGLRALTHNPSRLSGLVILNTVISPPRPGFRPTAFHKFAQMPVVSDVAFRLLAFPQNNLGMVQGDRSSIRRKTTLAYWWPLRDPRTNVAPLALARMVPNSLEHPTVAGMRVCEEVARSFAGPTAIVWGDSDPVLGRAVSHMQRILPRATVTRTKAGHFLQEEVPEVIAGAIRGVAGR